MPHSTLHVRRAGFLVRLIASLIDTIIIAIPLMALVSIISGGNYLDISGFEKALDAAQNGNSQMAFYYLNTHNQTSFRWELLLEILMAFTVILFWKKWRGATPGKKIMGIEIVDATTFTEITNQQAITRFIGYIISSIPLGIGFLLPIFREDKKALHDILAGTCVIYYKKKEIDETNSY